MRFAHTNIASSDWKKLSDFYIKTFDCQLVPPIRQQSGESLERGTGMKKASLEGAHLLLPGYGEDGPTLEIYQYENLDEHQKPTYITSGFGHIAFEVENVESTLNELIKNGGRSLGKITTKEVLGKGIITFVYAQDPEGNMIELQSWVKE